MPWTTVKVLSEASAGSLTPSPPFAAALLFCSGARTLLFPSAVAGLGAALVLPPDAGIATRTISGMTV